MTYRTLQRIVTALALSLVIGTLASAALAVPDLRRALSSELVLIVASVVTVLPLIVQSMFLFLQSHKQGRQAVALPFGVRDGWLLVLVLSALPSLFERDLARLASPALLILNTPPALSLKLAVALTVARFLFARREASKRGEGDGGLLTSSKGGERPSTRA